MERAGRRLSGLDREVRELGRAVDRQRLDLTLRHPAGGEVNPSLEPEISRPGSAVQLQAIDLPGIVPPRCEAAVRGQPAARRGGGTAGGEELRVEVPDVALGKKGGEAGDQALASAVEGPGLQRRPRVQRLEDRRNGGVEDDASEESRLFRIEVSGHADLAGAHGGAGEGVAVGKIGVGDGETARKSFLDSRGERDQQTFVEAAAQAVLEGGHEQGRPASRRLVAGRLATLAPDPLVEGEAVRRSAAAWTA